MNLYVSLKSSNRVYFVFFLFFYLTGSLLFATEKNIDKNAEEAINIERCNEIVAEYSDSHDDIIQKKLRAAYKNDACFEEEVHAYGKPLSDAIVGPITKTWINQYMLDYTEKACALDNQHCVDVGLNKKSENISALETSENGLKPYLLTEDDLSYFVINPDVFTVLKAKEDLSYITDSALLEAVANDLSLLKGMTDRLLNNYKKQIRRYIQPVNKKILTAESIDKLIVNNYLTAATALQSQVGKKTGVENFNRLIENIVRSAYLDELKKTDASAVVVLAGDNSKTDKSYDKDNKKQKKTREKKEKRNKKKVLTKNKLIEINKIMKIINLTIIETSLYQLHITEKSANEFVTIDFEVIECVRNISNIKYASKFSLKDALKEILTNIKKIKSGETVNGFNCDISTKLPDENKSDVPFDKVKKLKYAYDRKTLELLLRKAEKPFFGSNLNPIELIASDNCNECSLPMKGVNYGFYPFWQASSAYKDLGLPVVNPANVDFSVFTRIAYAALPVDENGSIENLLHWKDKTNIKAFVRSLNKYNVKRDLVLYTNNWQLWGRGKGEFDIKQTVEGYAEMHLVQVQKLQNLVEKEGGLSGITLYFDGYRRTSDASNIVNYIKHLKQQITKADESGTGVNFDINMVLGIAWDYESEKYCHVGSVSSKDDTYFKEFESLLINKNGEKQQASNVGDVVKEVENEIKDRLKGVPLDAADPALVNLLVFLHEPSSRAKKCLRLQIENEFHGGRRIDILRKVIPILGRAYLKENNNKFKQFDDDINYLKDNFGGIGMWPLPMSEVVDDAENKKVKSINNATLVIGEMSYLIKKKYSESYKNYIEYSKLGVIGDMLHQPVVTNYFSVCSVMCPGRGKFRYFLLFLITGSIVSFVAFRINCKAKKYIIKMKWIDIGLKGTALVVLLSVLGCDPFWQPMSNTILLISIVFGIGYFFYRTFFCGYESGYDE